MNTLGWRWDSMRAILFRAPIVGWDAGEYHDQKRIIVQRTHSKFSLAYLAALEEPWTATIEIEGMLLTRQEN